MGKGNKTDQWDKTSVRALRDHLGATQEGLARKLGARQQTISEWERGLYRPRGTAARLLTIIAEEAGFQYKVSPPQKAQAKEKG